jgi:serine/threonine-protein kinase
MTRAIILGDAGKVADVVKLLDPLRERMLARHDDTTIKCLMMLGDSVAGVGHEQEGLALLRKARELAESSKSIPAQTVMLASIAEMTSLMDNLRFEEANVRADAALAIWHELGDPPSRDIIDLYRGIAVSAEAIGDIPRADAAYRDAISVGDRFFDKPNWMTAWNLEAYATFLIAQGRLDEAEPVAARSLEMHRATLPADDYRTLYAIAAMGKLRQAQTHFADAIVWYTQAIDTCDARPKPELVCARLYALRARSYAMQRKFDDARRDIDQAKRRQIALSGDHSSAYAYVLDAEVAVLAAEHQYAEVITTADRALEIYRQGKGGMIQAQFGTRYWRALALFELHRDDEPLKEVLDIAPKYEALFPRGALTPEILALKARALDRAGRVDDARTAATDALSIDQASKLLDPDVLYAVRRIASGDDGAPPNSRRP